MAKPVDSDWKKLIRLARYLKGSPRCVWRFNWQEVGKKMTPTVYSDSD